MSVNLVNSYQISLGRFSLANDLNTKAEVTKMERFDVIVKTALFWSTLMSFKIFSRLNLPKLI